MSKTKTDTTKTEMTKSDPAKADHPKSEHKKHEDQAESSRSSKTKGHNPLPGNCFAMGCKASSNRFNFCDQHFEHFKFGLIRKTGEQVSDYEKKIEHFVAYQARQNTRKVA